MVVQSQLAGLAADLVELLHVLLGYFLLLRAVRLHSNLAIIALTALKPTAAWQPRKSLSWGFVVLGIAMLGNRRRVVERLVRALKDMIESLV